MKKIFCFLLIILSFAKICSAQKSKNSDANRIAIYTDFVLDILNEKNIGIEYKFSPRYAVGVTYGNIDDLKWVWKDLLLISSHDKNPGRYGTGNSIKIYGKYYFGNAKRKYLRIDGIYRTTKYDSLTFEDAYVSGGGDAQFKRNEENQTIGLNFCLGKEWAIRNFRIDGFFGFGFRNKYRNYTTFDRKVLGGDVYPDYAPMGSYTKRQNYFSFLIGLNIGFEYSFKTKKID